MKGHILVLVLVLPGLVGCVGPMGGEPDGNATGPGRRRVPPDGPFHDLGATRDLPPGEAGWGVVSLSAEGPPGFQTASWTFPGNGSEAYALELVPAVNASDAPRLAMWGAWIYGETEEGLQLQVVFAEGGVARSDDKEPPLTLRPRIVAPPSGAWRGGDTIRLVVFAEADWEKQGQFLGPGQPFDMGVALQGRAPEEGPSADSWDAFRAAHSNVPPLDAREPTGGFGVFLGAVLHYDPPGAPLQQGSSIRLGWADLARPDVNPFGLTLHSMSWNTPFQKPTECLLAAGFSPASPGTWSFQSLAHGLSGRGLLTSPGLPAAEGVQPLPVRAVACSAAEGGGREWDSRFDVTVSGPDRDAVWFYFFVDNGNLLDWFGSPAKTFARLSEDDPVAVANLTWTGDEVRVQVPDAFSVQWVVGPPPRA